jgi:hypothetical protein
LLVSIAGNPYVPESIGLLVSFKVIDPALLPIIFISPMLYSLNRSRLR